ncbi:MAG: 2-isopropylmalate synthase [Bacteroidota bacterium]
MSDPIIIFDTTLRDGEQAPGASMTLAEKVEIARHLARLHVDVIEAGFPISSPGQREAVRRVVATLADGPENSTGHVPVIAALGRATEADIHACGDALREGQRTRIHTFIATSDIHLDAKFGHPRFGNTLAEKRQTVVQMAQDAVRLAKTYTDDVEFSAEDAGRTDASYLCEIVVAAAEAGATTINIPDTTGYCLPHEYAAHFAAAKACLQDFPHVILSAHCHDDLGLACANSLAAVSAGARQIECTLNGIGERAGNAALEEIAMAIRTRGDQMGVHTNIATPHLTEASKLVAVTVGFAVPPNKAIVGKNAFSHEAGIHQHGVLKRRDTYEIMRAEDVGQAPAQIRLGRHSGRHGLFSRLDGLGVVLTEAEKDGIYERFVALADQKKEIYDEDLFALVNDQQRPVATATYRLDTMHVTTGSDQEPTATIALYSRKSDSTTEETAAGDGPVDALYRAIRAALGSTHELASYTIRSVSEGADALGEVNVVVTDGNGLAFRGAARSTDVLRASAAAYLDALNRLAAHADESDSAAFATAGIMQSFA